MDRQQFCLFLESELDCNSAFRSFSIVESFYVRLRTRAGGITMALFHYSFPWVLGPSICDFLGSGSLFSQHSWFPNFPPRFGPNLPPFLFQHLPRSFPWRLAPAFSLTPVAT